MSLSLTALAGIYVLAVSSVLPPAAGRTAQVTSDLSASARTGTLTVITPAAAPPPGALVAPGVSAFMPGLIARLPDENETIQKDDDAAQAGNCKIGYIVMIPDGREGRVTSRDGDTCRILAYGEANVSLWNEDMVEPVYPQELPRRVFGH